MQKKDITPLGAVRREIGLTQKELAEKSGVSLFTIQEYEKGRNDINNARCIIVVSLAEALGVPVQKIMNER